MCRNIFSSSIELSKLFIRVEKNVIHNIMAGLPYERGVTKHMNLKYMTLHMSYISNGSLHPSTSNILQISQLKRENIQSRVVRIEILGDAHLSDLSTPVRMIFPVMYANMSNLHCHYYNEVEYQWKTDGCQTFRANDMVTCRCNHTTAFSVLLIAEPIGAVHWKILSYIGYIGCGLSAFCTALSLMVYVTHRKHREEPSLFIHMSLSGALFLLNMSFLMSEWGATVSLCWVCELIAALIHFSLLGSFTWMAVEGLHLYLMLIKVFNTEYRHYLLKLSLFGWGIPAMIVGVTLSLKDVKQIYGLKNLTMLESNQTNPICWLRDETYFYVTNVTYFALVFIFNTGILLIVANRIRRLAKTSSRSGMSCRSASTVIGLTGLLGTTWGLAFLGSGHVNYPILYLFCIFNSTQEWTIGQWVERSLKSDHKVQIPFSVLQRSKGKTRGRPAEEVLLVISLLSSSHFEVSAGKEILGDLVLAVKVGKQPVSDLSENIQLFFKHNHTADDGTCVFWKDVPSGGGNWGSEGCNTSVHFGEFRCSCNHLSFFAVLVNPVASLDSTTAVNLSYISIIGSALSVICSILSLIIYTFLQRRRPDKSIGVHMQLTAAILCLHLSFLLGWLWSWLEGDGWMCQVFGGLLHWSLLGTITWTAIEGFHLYILLVRVFNIYIRKYLLKLSVVGWGVPTVIAVTCGLLHIYGKFTLTVTDSATNSNTTHTICWITNQPTDQSTKPVIYILMLIYMGLMLLFNSAMLGLVVVKLWSLRSTSSGFRGTSDRNNKWKLMDREKRSRLCKDLVTVLGLSCVLGLAWSFSYTTYSSFSAPGLYLFTILNSLQGVFMFLWSLALTCKSGSENDSSAQYSSSKKMEISFNSK
ncbi:unnamed protein product [Merluccius merluccius]